MITVVQLSNYIFCCRTGIQRLFKAVRGWLRESRIQWQLLIIMTVRCDWFTITTEHYTLEVSRSAVPVTRRATYHVSDYFRWQLRRLQVPGNLFSVACADALRTCDVAKNTLVDIIVFRTAMNVLQVTWPCGMWRTRNLEIAFAGLAQHRRWSHQHSNLREHWTWLLLAGVPSRYSPGHSAWSSFVGRRTEYYSDCIECHWEAMMSSV